MNCKSKDFLEILQEYGHSMYERGVLVGKGSTGRGKKFKSICDKIESQIDELMNKYSPPCTCKKEF